MKATRKLIPAIAMLLISAVMMSTATFAWFSTNSAVTATGMKVSAKADSTFLIISSANDAEFAEAGYQKITATAAPADPATENVLIPVTFVENSSIWQTATASDPNASAANEETREPVEDMSLSSNSYLFKRTFYFRVATNFKAASNLKLTKVETAGDNSANSKCLSVVAVPSAATDWSKFNAYDCVTGTYTNTTALYDTVDQTVIAVDVYVFIDGEHTDVKTTNVTNLQGLEVKLTFAVG